MSWSERQGERDQPVFDAETKQWTWREDRTPPWARRLALVFRGFAAIARLAVVALLVMALLRGWWVTALIAALLVTISVGWPGRGTTVLLRTPEGGSGGPSRSSLVLDASEELSGESFGGQAG